MSELYETDIVSWSERQGELLRRIARGERVNDADLDWPNIIEEIECVGRSEVKGVRSALLQYLLHDLKAKAWPDSAYVEHWRTEATHALNDARDDFLASMRGKIDLAAIYRRAVRELPRVIDGQLPLPVPAECPVTLDELLAQSPDT